MKLAKYKKNRTQSLVPVSGTPAAPLWPMQRLQHAVDRIFTNPFDNWLLPDEPLDEWMPVLNVYEEKDNFVVEAELPGMKKDEIQIYMTGDTLNITGKRQGEHEQRERDMYRSERYFGRFHLMVSLPAPINADKIDAHYRDGLLSITCPKTEEAKRRTIEVKTD